MTTRTISSTVTSAVTFGSYGTIGAYNTVSVTNQGAVVVTGTGGAGIAVDGHGVLINSGLVSGAAAGVFVYASESVTNQSGGLIEGGTAGIAGYGTITNAGTIEGGTFALDFDPAASNRLVADPGAVFIGTVFGGGVGADGGMLEFASGASSGTFSGLGSHYVNFTGVSIDSGANWAAYGANTITSGETLIDAGLLFSPGQLTNSGTVVVTSGGGIVDDGGTFANDGSVTASSLNGVVVAAGGLVTNAATASITDNSGSSAGVDVGGGATLVNAGLISGGMPGGVNVGGGVVTNLAGGTITGTNYGLSGYDLTLVNAGTIAAASASGNAVRLQHAGNSRVVVDPGAAFIGTVNGFNTIGASAVSTLEFASGASGGIFVGLGSHYVNFAQVSVDTGANWTVSGTNTIAAGETLTDSGALTFASAPVGGGSMSLAGHGITLASDGRASIGPSIAGLAGNAVELVGTVEGYAKLTGHELTLDGGTTLTLASSYTTGQVSVTNDGTDTFITACFAGGTGIATARGAVAVEALEVGERVVTASGRLAPVVWIGHRLVDLRRHARPFDVVPVRVCAGALGNRVPTQDLMLSPDHAVLVDGYLVPVRYLINGRSIVQEVRETVTYWHVELDRHDLVLAEGAACESYLDTGNRGAFENGGDSVALHPEFGREHALTVWEEAACAPILFDPRDPALRALHTRLLARAERVARAA